MICYEFCCHLGNYPIINILVTIVIPQANFVSLCIHAVLIIINTGSSYYSSVYRELTDYKRLDQLHWDNKRKVHAQ